MDLDPEKIQDVLTEVDLPSTVLDLQNPTEEYVLNLWTQFLHKLSINVATIKKPTPEQMSYACLTEDCSEIISLINISMVMAGICNQMIFKDKNIFFLTDLTSPMPKRTRKIVKILSNFLLYVQNKNALIDDRSREITLKHQKLEEINQKRSKYLELSNKDDLEKANKLNFENRMKSEIAQMRTLRNAKKAEIVATQEKLKAIEKEKIKIIQYHENSTANAIKMQKIIEDAASRVVKSPERYLTRLRELHEQKKKQEEKRETMQEAIISKRTTIERVQNHVSFVTHAHAKISEATTDAYKRLQQLKKVPEKRNKKTDEINALLRQEATMLEQKGSQGDDEILQKKLNQCEQHLAWFYTGIDKMLNKKKCLELNLANKRTRQQEICSERDSIRILITKIESDTAEFLRDCQETYNNEINWERKLRLSLVENISRE